MRNSVTAPGCPFRSSDTSAPMKKKTFLSALLLPLVLAGCNSLQKKEALLVAAGFKTVVPATPIQVQKLHAAPQGKMLTLRKDGKTLFVFADAKRNHLLIGTQRQYQAYQQLRLEKQLAGEKLAAAALNADANIDWNDWGGLEAPYWGPTFNDPVPQ